MPRQYTHIQLIGNDILEMRAEGKNRREIWEHFGITKKQYSNFITRHNRNQEKLEAGLNPRRKGRPSIRNPLTEEEKDYQIKRLRMENELLRDFLRVAGRK